MDNKKSIITYDHEAIYAEFLKRSTANVEYAERQLARLISIIELAKENPEDSDFYSLKKYSERLKLVTKSTYIDIQKLAALLQSLFTSAGLAANMAVRERMDAMYRDGRDQEYDKKHNNGGTLLSAAMFLLTGERSVYPEGWDLTYAAKWEKLPFQGKLIKAASLLMAEADRHMDDPAAREGIKFLRSWVAEESRVPVGADTGTKDYEARQTFYSKDVQGDGITYVLDNKEIELQANTNGQNFMVVPINKKLYNLLAAKAGVRISVEAIPSVPESVTKRYEDGQPCTDCPPLKQAKNVLDSIKNMINQDLNTTLYNELSWLDQLLDKAFIEQYQKESSDPTSKSHS